MPVKQIESAPHNPNALEIVVETPRERRFLQISGFSERTGSLIGLATRVLFPETARKIRAEHLRLWDRYWSVPGRPPGDVIRQAAAINAANGVDGFKVINPVTG